MARLTTMEAWHESGEERAAAAAGAAPRPAEPAGPDAEEQVRRRRPLGLVLQLAAALIVSALALRTITASHDGAAPPAPPAPGQRSARAGGAPPMPPATPAASTAPARPDQSRTYFANPAAAEERLGFTVVQPRRLPEGVGTLFAAWQPDEPLLVPGLPVTGTLLAWYFTWNQGVMLMLAQGPQTVLSQAGAPAGRSGALLLSDGRRAIWVRGHADSGAGAPAPGWTGDELRLGVAPVDGRPGWWIESRVLTLEELVWIAEGVR